ncbi:P-loop containing nucleoside triphosphate hydrolase protein [Mycena alexandri]|uniref:DNA 3'-5' helicase n=1 Tax=Mycena alexandri TaxID=1745969 RepID=A0AAD6T012_9AGAR|nr:P-loop containing nucleoside triphosphate hydrolase protein [Mycena alexandri]
MPSDHTPRHHGKTPGTHRTRVKSKITPEQLNAIKQELKLLPGLIKTHYSKWNNGAQEFQIQCMEAQKLGQDVILHAATGAGKTGIAAGPHLLSSSAGKVTLVVSPLLSLHEEQVVTFRNEFGLKATAINSANGGCTKPIMEGVVNGEWQIVILSPEMLLSRRFIDGVLRKPAFGARCLSVFIDEAHCISHWGDSFRKKYASIGIIRAFLPRSTPIIAVTATLTPRVRQDLVTKLQFDPNNYIFCTIGNDRPNVCQIVRALEHPANSYRDLDFMVDMNMTLPKDVKKAFLYTDDIQDGGKLVDHLNGRVCPAYRSRGLVRPYNAGMSPKYRAEVMALFKAGIIRILVCTDAAGMGCDIPDIDLVVQWKLPKNLSSWVQRAGRVARARGRTGMAVMLVEKTALEVGEADELAGAEGGGGRGRGHGRGRASTRGRGGGGRGRTAGTTKRGKDYAVSQPIDIPSDAPGEGLYTFIQATVCRRVVLASIFKNVKPTVPALDCCDICNPKLFDHTRPSKPIRMTRQKGIKRGPPLDSVRQALFVWRRNIKKQHFACSIFAPHAILDDATCELLASVGPFDSLDMLKQLLESGWSLWEEFGVQLHVYLHGLNIPPLPAPPPRKKVSADPAAAAPTPSAPPAGPSSTSSTANKRRHDSHSTPLDTSAPPSQRPRHDLATPQVSSASPTMASLPPSLPRPVPRPLYRSQNQFASSSRTPITQSSPLPQLPLQHPRYLPTTPLRAPTYALPPYPPPFYPQGYDSDPRMYYSPHPGPGAFQTHSSPTYPYPMPSAHPHATYPSMPAPSTLRNNPYAALVSRGFSVPTPVSHNVTASPAPPQPSEPSSSVFPSNSDQSTSFDGH